MRTSIGVRVAILVLTLTPLAASCGGSGSGQNGGEGLVAAQHPECATTGTKLLHYLATGDNGGDPSYDRNYGAYVHEPLPQARARADTAIEYCDTTLTGQAIGAAAAASTAAAATSQQQAAATSQQQAAALVEPVRIESCHAIGGSYPSVNGLCNCPHIGGYCAFADVVFDSNGRINQSDFAQKKAAMPGCWPK
jgi:hypothetical protein